MEIVKTRNNYRSHWHCVYQLQFHLVLVTKYRRKCFSKPILNRLKEICSEQCLKWGIHLLEFGGEEDHVHLLLEMHPNIMPSRFINSLKTTTSRYIRKEYKQHLGEFYWKDALWTRAYCLLTTGGAPLEVIRKYIEKQGVEKENSGRYPSPPK